MKQNSGKTIVFIVVFAIILVGTIMMLLITQSPQRKNNNTEKPVVTDEQIKKYVLSEGSQLYPFYAGYAVIRDNNTAQFAIINHHGDVLISSDERPDIFPYHRLFNNGLFLYADITTGMSNPVFKIMDIEGRLLLDFADYNMTFIRVNPENDTIEVTRTPEDSNSNEPQYGILDSTGRWIMETTDGYKSMFALSNNIVLCVIESSSNPDHYDRAVLINTDSGEKLELSNGVLGSISNSLHSRPTETENKIVALTTIDDQTGVYSINNDLSYKLIFPYDDSIKASSGTGLLSEGIFYISDKKALYNLEGEKVLDITEETIGFYQSVYTKYPYMSDGFLQKVFKNVSGDTLYTLIDKNGNITYEPSDLRFIGGISEGLIPVKNNDFTGYIDTNGNKVLGINGEFGDVSSFNDGIAIVYSTAYEAYVYIDTEGNILFENTIKYR